MAPLLLVDDDPLSLEVLALLTGAAGYAVETFASGVALLEALPARVPGAFVLLADMQMPAPCGDTLAGLVRAAAGSAWPGTILIAMSANTVDPALRRGYDAFLLKPFTMEELGLAIAGAPAVAAAGVSQAALDAEIFRSFAASLPPAQLQQLYSLCLDDAERRIDTLVTARRAGDDAAFRAGAHALKGGCGLVGAREMAALAEQMETDGLAGSAPSVDHVDPCEEFLAASARLRDILVAQYGTLPHVPGIMTE